MGRNKKPSRAHISALWFKRQIKFPFDGLLFGLYLSNNSSKLFSRSHHLTGPFVCSWTFCKRSLLVMGSQEFWALEKRERRTSGVYGLLRFSHLPERCKRNDLVPYLTIPYFDWLKSTSRYLGLLTGDKSAWNLLLSRPFYRSLNSFHKLSTRRCKFPPSV